MLMEGARRIPSIAWTMVKYYSIFYACKTYLLPVDLVVLSGASMEPTLCDRDLVLVEKYSVYTHKLK